MKKLTLTLGLFSGLMMSTVYASDADIMASLQKLGYTKADVQIQKTPMANMSSVTTPDGVLYISSDGKFLTQGPIYDMSGATPENIANADNLKLIESIASDAIVYKAKDEKYAIYVFSDYTCAYCKKLHEEINTYLDAGISVHYFAFPRAGLDSDVAKNMQSIWSAKDRKAAFDNAYKGGKISPASSMVPYVEMQYNVGRKLGLSGTPAIILPNGQLLAGYVPVDKLLPLLEKTTK
ncbi:thiol:disulfide interchange protein DsbC [Orbus hercynius]|uniref:Thiol:disulfide interchange protein n=1 Tax=Orbus hercynius TaxID=593135 RepID=A0A495REY8_9GAMM|nr:bifunctional protein-disulfide isomerase/oxidoreductase DsbC [Orbus hercynius]RKS85766.1 thiol:disulfide interchange protein DsbC [Orbus hercynius]